MANRWLFAGGGIDQVRGSVSASTSGRDASYADHGVDFANQGFYDFIDDAGASDKAVAGETLFVRFGFQQNSATNGTGYRMLLVDDANQPWLAIRSRGTGLENRLYYNSGTGASPTWTLIGNTPLPYSGFRHVFMEIHIGIGGNHSISWSYLYGGVTTTLDTGLSFSSSMTELSAVGFGPQISSNQKWWVSEVAATVGIGLTGSRVKYLNITGAGSNSGFTTGSYLDVDDQGASAIDDATLLISDTTGQRSTFAYADLPTLATEEIIGPVTLSTRVRNSGGTPANAKPVRRTSGGSDLVGSAFSGMTTSFTNYQTRFTGLSYSEVNGSEFGVESST